MQERYDAATALIVVDLQNDFADPAGGLAVAGGTTIIPRINAEIEAARAAGATIVYTQDWHPESTPHFEKDGGTWPVHCVADTWGAELHPDLDVRGPVVRKGTSGDDGYSGFTERDPVSGEPHPTQLGSLLAPDVRRIGDYCVKETALDGVLLGYDVVVPLGHTRFVNLSAGDDDRAVADLEAAGVTVERDVR
jgi:nicotinamidase/pyrazinamidase